MKKIIPFLLLLVLSSSTFSQQSDPAPTLTKQDYLQKSKNQKTVAFILLGASIVTLAYAAQLDNDYFGFAKLIAYTGGVCAFISVIYFIDSNKNKHKAMKLSLKIQSLPQLQNIDLVNQTIPSLSLKIRL